MLDTSTTPRIDAHCHLWQLDRGDYHWLDTSNPEFRSIAYDFTIDDLATATKNTNVSQFIAVQAAATEAETDYLLSLADENSDILGVVGWVDLAGANAVNSIDRFSKHTAFKGIRPMLQDIENTTWLVDVPAPHIWTHLEQNNLRFDALITPRHLPMIHQFCLDHPNLPIVIDHAAKPDIAGAHDEAFKTWCSNMSAIAQQSNTHCKISGLLTKMAPAQLPNAHTILEPFIDHLLDVFGPERLMWGSDWPVVLMAGDYNIWNDLTMKLLQDLSHDSRALILGGSAAKFYGITGAYK
jgi:L-fuconolactonase